MNLEYSKPCIIFSIFWLHDRDTVRLEGSRQDKSEGSASDLLYNPLA